jgi:hypothetical protein
MVKSNISALPKPHIFIERLFLPGVIDIFDRVNTESSPPERISFAFPPFSIYF